MKAAITTMLTRIEIITCMLVTYLLYVFQRYSTDLSGYQQEEQEFLNRPVRRFRSYFSEFRVFVVLYIWYVLYIYLTSVRVSVSLPRV